jgi:hypothetical protein
MNMHFTTLYLSFEIFHTSSRYTDARTLLHRTSTGLLDLSIILCRLSSFTLDAANRCHLPLPRIEMWIV